MEMGYGRFGIREIENIITYGREHDKNYFTYISNGIVNRPLFQYFDTTSPTFLIAGPMENPTTAFVTVHRPCVH
jgi:hypothetical protein